MEIKETVFYLEVKVKTYLYDKKGDWDRYLQIIKSLDGRFDWNKKVWLVDKRYKTELMQGLRVTFTLNELKEANEWFDHWWQWLSSSEELIPFPSYDDQSPTAHTQDPFQDLVTL